MKVIGTAGHIDHGKSTLVRRLTDIDPDRLEEEKRRGMTIDLGFAWFRLPSGEQVSVVDVPGHERFIRNMLAGAGGIDVALLVVAADEGIMPQTREHVDILQLLGVRLAVVALSKADLVDGEWLALVTDDVESYLKETSLARAPIVPVSATNGHGISRLSELLQEQVALVPSRPDTGFPWMPIDRSFTVKGFGTVVTGTLHGGALETGEVVELIPGGNQTRIRNLQVHQRDVIRAGVGSRVAVNVTNVPREGIDRGDMMALPDTVVAISRFDAQVTVLAHSTVPLRHGLEATIHIGAAERQAVLYVMSGDEIAPGNGGWVRVKTDVRVPVVPGEHFILRLPTPARTFAGGRVIDVRPSLRLRDPRGVARLQAMDGSIEADRIVAILMDYQLYSREALITRSGLSRDSLQHRLAGLEHAGRIVRIDQMFVHRERWSVMVSRVREILGEHHRRFPLAPGMPREELRQNLRWPSQAWAAALTRMDAAGDIQLRSAHVMLPGHQSGLEARRADADLVLRELRAAPFAPPPAGDLMLDARIDQQLLRAMVDAGEIVAVSSDFYYEPQAYADLVDIVVRELRATNELTVAHVRDLMGTSRKYALALLEHLDEQRITRRSGDVRVLGSRAPACA